MRYTLAAPETEAKTSSAAMCIRKVFIVVFSFHAEFQPASPGNIPLNPSAGMPMAIAARIMPNNERDARGRYFGNRNVTANRAPNPSGPFSASFAQ